MEEGLADSVVFYESEQRDNGSVLCRSQQHAKCTGDVHGAEPSALQAAGAIASTYPDLPRRTGAPHLAGFSRDVGYHESQFLFLHSELPLVKCSGSHLAKTSEM